MNTFKLPGSATLEAHGLNVYIVSTLVETGCKEFEEVWNVWIHNTHNTAELQALQRMQYHMNSCPTCIATLVAKRMERS